MACAFKYKCKERRVQGPLGEVILEIYLAYIEDVYGFPKHDKYFRVIMSYEEKFNRAYCFLKKQVVKPYKYAKIYDQIQHWIRPTNKNET